MTRYQEFASTYANPRGAEGPPPQPGANFRQGTEGVLRFYEGMARMWTNMLFGFYGPWMSAAMPFFPNPWAGAAPGGPVGQPTPMGAETHLAVEILGERSIRTTLQLEAGAENIPLKVKQLTSDDGAPPIENVSIEQRHYRQPLMLRVEVPESQPPGLYQGAVFDPRNDWPVGHLRVYVR